MAPITAKSLISSINPCVLFDEITIGITAVFMYLSLMRPNPQPLTYQGRGVNQTLSERGLPERSVCGLFT